VPEARCQRLLELLCAPVPATAPRQDGCGLRGPAMTNMPLDKISNMPAFSPYYPMPPALYRGVVFQWVYFEAD
jgi:hypothetical protein